MVTIVTILNFFFYKSRQNYDSKVYFWRENSNEFDKEIGWTLK